MSARADLTKGAGARAAGAGIAGVVAARLDEARRASETIVIPIGALIVSALVFSIFLIALGKSPAAFFELLWRGGFASAFSLQNTLVRAAPLILTALCVAVPAQLGLIIIGGEGALAIGGLAAGVAALPLVGKAPPAVVALSMASVGMLAGAMWPVAGQWTVLVPLFLIVSVFPTVVINSTAVAQGLDRQRAGGVAAVLGAIQGLLGASAIAATSALGDGSPQSLAVTMVTASAVAAALSFAPRRRRAAVS